MQISDEKLYELCEHYGKQARLWRQKFAGLLPEVYRRRLYERHGFGSIFEFAAKLAGMSEEQVSRVLTIEKKFDDKPILKSLLEKGEVSVNKLARIASVATLENQEFWAEQVRILPQKALEVMIRDATALSQHVFGDKFVRTHKPEATSRVPQGLNLSEEVTQELFELQQKGIDINVLISGFLAKREFEIATEKEELSAKQNIPTKHSRHIPVEIQRLVEKEFGEKCAVPGCIKRAERLHHTNRFAMSRNHDPYFLAPLCKEHHVIAHSIDVKFHGHLK